MLHDLLGALPPETLAKIFTISAVTAAAVGVLLWLGGAMMSRTIVTLQLVSIGGSLGMYLPMATGWRLEGWATALGGALIFGAIGFFLHRLWAAVGLGVVLAGWAAVATWAFYNNGVPWQRPTLPVISAESLQGITTSNELLKRFPPEEFIKPLWASVPGEVQRRLPYACGGAAVWGLIVGLLWPRLGVALLYSCLGVSLLTGAGLYARSVGFEWISHLPSRWQEQVGLLAAMVVFGAVVQWWMNPLGYASSRPPQRSRPEPAE